MQNIVLKQFPIHIAKTENKEAPNKYVKITNQSIYSGSLNRFGRAIAIRNIHKWILNKLLDLSLKDLPELTQPVQLQLSIYTVVNHGDIRRKKDGTISWNKPDKDYKPRWDEDNLRTIWEKTIKDCISKVAIWEDDTVDICRGTNSIVYFVDELDDRKIEINFKKI